MKTFHSKESFEKISETERSLLMVSTHDLILRDKKVNKFQVPEEGPEVGRIVNLENIRKYFDFTRLINLVVNFCFHLLRIQVRLAIHKLRFAAHAHFPSSSIFKLNRRV